MKKLLDAAYIADQEGYMHRVAAYEDRGKYIIEVDGGFVEALSRIRIDLDEEMNDIILDLSAKEE